MIKTTYYEYEYDVVRGQAEWSDPLPRKGDFVEIENYRGSHGENYGTKTVKVVRVVRRPPDIAEIYVNFNGG